MKLYIEGIIFIILFFFTSIWFMWFKWSERRLLKKYKPENDKGRKGNEFRTAERGTKESTIINNGNEQHERREFLQETNANNDGKDSTSNRKLKFIRRS